MEGLDMASGRQVPLHADRGSHVKYHLGRFANIAKHPTPELDKDRNAHLAANMTRCTFGAKMVAITLTQRQDCNAELYMQCFLFTSICCLSTTALVNVSKPWIT